MCCLLPGTIHETVLLVHRRCRHKDHLTTKRPVLHPCASCFTSSSESSSLTCTAAEERRSGQDGAQGAYHQHLHTLRAKVHSHVVVRTTQVGLLLRTQAEPSALVSSGRGERLSHSTHHVLARVDQAGTEPFRSSRHVLHETFLAFCCLSSTFTLRFPLSRGSLQTFSSAFARLRLGLGLLRFLLRFSSSVIRPPISISVSISPICSYHQREGPFPCRWPCLSLSLPLSLPLPTAPPSLSFCSHSRSHTKGRDKGVVRKAFPRSTCTSSTRYCGCNPI